MSEDSYKIVVVGEARVGKTSISLKFAKNEFDENQLSTIDCSYCNKTINYKGRKQTLNIWVLLIKDTAGQEKFHSITSIYYKEANGALIVYDICDQESFQKLKQWADEIEREVPGIPIVLVANKCDLEKVRTVNAEEAEK